MALVKLGSKAEGSIVKLKENGVLVDFYIAKQNYESGLNGSGRVLVVRKDCCDGRQWDSNYNNAYATSSIDAWLNGPYKNLLDSDIQTAMGATNIYYYIKGTIFDVTTLARSVFLLSVGELVSNVGGSLRDGTLLPSTVIDLLKIDSHADSADRRQWTRTPRRSYSGDAEALRFGDNYIATSSVSMSLCFRPALTLPASLHVREDGSVTTNTAPATPSSITIPSQINGGSTITVEWGIATDAEGNLEGYVAERSTDGGSSWRQIYQGGMTRTTNIVPFGTPSVMYRVKAYDAEGMESGYKTSGQVTVINNTAPTVPGSITVPEAVQGGQPLAVAWGASSDGENNLAGYSLERQVDGGGWAVVYSGQEQNFTDQITKGWQAVAYRVRAYDSHNAYSGFAVSETRTVNNNTPPAIVCEYPANTPLGVKNEGFEIPYSVTDEEEDEVTVTETVDGTALRTFTAQLGAENSFTLGGVDFMKLLNGAHTLVITASDGKVGAAHSLPFTKKVTSASVTLEQPMTADGVISVCALAVSGSIPADASFQVEVTNNTLDDTPVWEDCTAAVRAGANHIFANKAAAQGFAFNFRLNVSRGPEGLGGYITSVQGGFQ